MKEASKAARRRALDSNPVYSGKAFVGKGLDVGCGDDMITIAQYPNATEIVGYDHILGNTDAQTLDEIFDNSFDFIHSSHCLEHCSNPKEALLNWIRVVKPGGFIVICVPDELLYEQGRWPSMFNHDHKVSFTLRDQPIIKTSLNVNNLLDSLPGLFSYRHTALIEVGYDYKLNAAMGSPFITDQTYPLTGPECAIEIILQKK